MDEQGLPLPSLKRPRRRHAPEFKEQVVKASFEPGQSVAGVAQQFNINANLVHKWRRQHRAASTASPDDFVRLALPSAPAAPVAVAGLPEEIRVEVPGALGSVTVHWPSARVDALAAWLKALQA